MDFIRRKWNNLVSYVIKGFLVLIPSVTTIFVFIKVFGFLDSIVPGLITTLVPMFDKDWIPGIGILLIVITSYFVGSATEGMVVDRMIKIGDKILSKIPMMNKIYLLVQQITETINKSQKMIFEKPVLIEYPKEGTYCIGFVTATTGGEITDKIERELYSIFVPTTPNPTSGFLLFVPKEETIELDMTVETAIKTVVSAGLISEEEIKKTSQLPLVEKGIVSEMTGKNKK